MHDKLLVETRASCNAKSKGKRRNRPAWKMDMDIIPFNQKLFEQVKLSPTMTSSGHKNIADCRYKGGKDLKQSKSYKCGDKIPDSYDITSEDKDMGSTGWQTSNDEAKIEIPNPNGRRPSASVVSEVWNTPFETKESKFEKDSMLSCSPSQNESLDKSILSVSSSTAGSRQALSDLTSDSDFVLHPEELSMSSCEVRGSPYSKPETKPVTMSELPSKSTVLESLNFVIEPKVNMERVVSSGEKRKEREVVAVKPYSPSLDHISKDLISNSPVEIPNQCRKRKNKNMSELCEQSKLQRAVIKQEDKLEFSFKSFGTTRKYREGCCDVFKNYLLGVNMWCKKRRT